MRCPCAKQIDMLIVGPELFGRILRGLTHNDRPPAHQCISFVFSAAVPALLAVSASEGIDILPKHATENVRPIRAVLDRIDDSTRYPSHTASSIIHIHLHPEPRDPGFTLCTGPASDIAIAGKEHLLPDIVDEVLVQGVRNTRARRLRGQEFDESRPSIILAVTEALSIKECDRAAGVIKVAVTKVLEKRK